MDLGIIEKVGLFLELKKHEMELDNTVSSVYVRLEKELFNKLSIDEMENLEILYSKNIDVLKKRG